MGSGQDWRSSLLVEVRHLHALAVAGSPSPTDSIMSLLPACLLQRLSSCHLSHDCSIAASQ